MGSFFFHIFQLLIKTYKAMAVIQMGSIVTGIKGSVGGTTFRKSGNVQTMYNKVSGNSKSQNAKNQQVGKLASIIKDWSNLNNTQRQAWEANASRFRRTDKFGNVVEYTGRQMYIAHRWAIDETNIQLQDPNNIIDDAPAIDLTSIDTLFPLNGFLVSFDNPLSGRWFGMRVDVLASRASKVIINRSKIEKIEQVTNQQGYNVYSEFQDRWWSKTEGIWLGIQLFNISESGWATEVITAKKFVEMP